MPPRARKTAAPAPSLEDGAGSTPEQPEVGEPIDPTMPEADPATGAEAAAAPDSDADAGTDEPAPSQGDDNDVPEEPDGDAGDGEADAAPTEPAFHWQSVKNDGAPVCHLCNPGGPPPGVGVYGCSHGQWVRVVEHAAN